MQVRGNSSSQASLDSGAIEISGLPPGTQQSIQTQLEDMMRRLGQMLAERGNASGDQQTGGMSGLGKNGEGTIRIVIELPASALQSQKSGFGGGQQLNNLPDDEGYDSGSDDLDDSGLDDSDLDNTDVDDGSLDDNSLDSSNFDDGSLSPPEDEGYDSDVDPLTDDDDDSDDEILPQQQQQKSTPAVSTPAPAVTASPSSNSTGAFSGAAQTEALSPEQSKSTAEAWVGRLQKDFGLTKPQAEGIVANLWHESGGMNSGINQGGKIGAPSSNNADDNANGYGMAQWGGVRKEGLINYARQHGVDPSSQEASYGYLAQELRGDQSASLDAVKGTSSATDATQAFCNAFEKPSDPQMASRLAYLNQMA